ncbi:hypothetical protein CF386_09660 [Paraphotobacterium marinum]|uniref:Uncharacterized protein n=1 Tax=Paraphotobacterium marinum TaxID=1755811 RepID=A0A220VGM1_9GAMM|nr:VUT family protein [Paraphotobacterium marinum]ASK79322.1 hypothetical protein CF386_09660 [Paraphotobacterium marinum]
MFKKLMNSFRLIKNMNENIVVSINSDDIVEYRTPNHHRHGKLPLETIINDAKQLESFSKLSIAQLLKHPRGKKESIVYEKKPKSFIPFCILFTSFIILSFISNIFSIRLIEIHEYNLVLSSGILFIPLTFMALNIIYELYGFRLTKFLILASTIGILAFSFINYLVLDISVPLVEPNIHQLKNINHSLDINFFLKILTMHIVTACSLVTLIASLISCYISTIFKNIFKEKFFALRLCVSIFIGQMILSFLWVEILLRYTDLLELHKYFNIFLTQNIFLAISELITVPLIYVFLLWYKYHLGTMFVSKKTQLNHEYL